MTFPRDQRDNNPKPLTAPEKAFWKDAFLTRARTMLAHQDGIAPDQAASICADFADAAMDAYRSRIIWAKP
jgi:hypothetical protein